MQSLRSQYPSNLDKNEVRASRYGALDFFQQDAARANSILTPNTKALIKRSFGNSVVIPVLDSQDVTIGNVRSCTIADSENSSALVTLTFATYAFGFTMTPSQHYNNDVGYQADFDRKLLKYLLAFAATLDTAAVAVLETYKNQLSTALSAYYTFSGGALQVTQALKTDYYNTLEAIFQSMDYYGKTHIITNPNGVPLVKRLQNQGAGNSNNEEFQMSGYEWHTTNRIANAGGIQSTQYAVQEGSVAIDNRNDPDSIAGSNVGGIKKWEEVQVPIVNMQMGSFYTEDCADRSALQSGTTGLTRTKLEGYEWSTDICFVTAYNSDIAAQYQPILKTQISAS